MLKSTYETNVLNSTCGRMLKSTDESKVLVSLPVGSCMNKLYSQYTKHKMIFIYLNTMFKDTPRHRSVETGTPQRIPKAKRKALIATPLGIDIT